MDELNNLTIEEMDGDETEGARTAETLHTTHGLMLGSCSDCLDHNLGDFMHESLGRILRFRFRLLNICPNRRVVVGLILFEIVNNLEVPRGFKVITVPAHTNNRCINIDVENVHFLLPDNPHTCVDRRFVVRHMHHYIDFPNNCFTF